MELIGGFTDAGTGFLGYCCLALCQIAEAARVLTLTLIYLVFAWLGGQTVGSYISSSSRSSR